MVKSLKIKKNRQKHGLFVAEGKKMVNEATQSNYTIKWIIHTPYWKNRLPALTTKRVKSMEVSELRFAQLSSHTNPEGIMVILIIPEQEQLSISSVQHWGLLLDGINDPGNLGTILRSAYWFGIKTVICSPNCVDVYNPKVVQASMGSIFHVSAYYKHLEQIIASEKCPIYAATSEGGPLHQTEKLPPGFLLVGSESHGISQTLLEKVDKKLSITQIGGGESLNAAVATGILLSHLCYPS